MPNCFTLTRKGESQPASMQAIDDEMRVEFSEEPDPDHWLWGWYDTIGYGLALGKNWAELRKQFAEDPAESERTNLARRRKLAVIYWLEANYVPDAWAEVGR